MNKKIRVGLVQINNSFSNQNYFPYSVGLLQALAQEYLANIDNFEFLLPIYKRIPVDIAVKSLLDAEIVFFSVYVWNFNISLEIARQIKKNKPQTLIIFGGPHVPLKATEEFLRSLPLIDIICHGEGEINFPSILENYFHRDWENVPSISYIDEKGNFNKTPLCERMADLNKIPSPYLEGIFDSLIAANPQEEWVALWETNRGCPFLCTYCDWGSATKNKVYAHGMDKLLNEMDWFSKNQIEFVFCCDANFGIMKRDILIVKHFARNKRRHGYPKALSVQSTKNFTEPAYEIYRVMSKAGLNKGVALSLQSLNPDTLKDIKRKNISTEEFQETQQRLSSFNIETFTDLILGLPNETYDTFAEGTSAVIVNGQHNRIQFNNLSILPNAQMGEPQYKKKFGFHIVETKIINIHGSLEGTDEVYETQQLVVGTNTMPKSDWVKTRVFSWLASLLHFDKLLQVPFIILHNNWPVSFRELIEVFASVDKDTPILYDIHSFFVKKAADIQNGGAEFCESKKWLNIWWPADELFLIQLCTENRLVNFYEEAKHLIERYLQKRKFSDYEPVLNQSIFLNQNLIKLPFQKEDLKLHLSYNLWDVYSAALMGKRFSLEKGEFHYSIDRTSNKWFSWEDWCREVIWYGNKKGAYIYGCKPLPCETEPLKHKSLCL